MTLAAVKTAHKGTVLVIDDDPDVCMMVRLILADAGYTCFMAATSDEGLRLLDEGPFDLVLTDMFLEGSQCSGLELIELVGRRDDSIPVILITGHPSINRAVDAMKRGAVDFLVKPFDRDLLLHQVGKAIQERLLRMENRRLQAEVNKAAVIEKLNRELDRRVGELTRLYAISEGLNSVMDSPALFGRIAELAVEVTGAQRVSVMLLDKSRSHLKIRSAIGVPGEVVAQTIQTLGHGVAGQVAQTGLPLRVTRQAGQLVAAERAMLKGHYRTNSWLSVPLFIGQEIFGVINATDKLDGSDFTREDEQLLMTLAEKAGIKLENQALYEGIYSNLIDTLNALVTTLEAKDPYTHEHSRRVTAYAVELGRHIGLAEEELEMLSFAGMLHDIGKIGVRDHLLTKRGVLDGGEYELVKMHPIVGERIVRPLGLVGQELAIIRHHHERFDGLGYPDGLAGERIPLLARIVTVTDSFDAMTTTRSYRSAQGVEISLEEMKRCSGSQFDPALVQALVECIEAGKITVVPMEHQEAINS